MLQELCVFFYKSAVLHLPHPSSSSLTPVLLVEARRQEESWPLKLLRPVNLVTASHTHMHTHAKLFCL